MSQHLTQDQFARCFLGRFTNEERRHIDECSECKAELAQFGNSISSFRNAVRNRIDAREAMHVVSIPKVPLRRVTARIPKWQWALAAVAVVVLAIVPFLTRDISPRNVAESTPDPNAVMDAVNRNLSRALPAPMEPVMTLIPADQYTYEPRGGGLQ